MVILNNLKEIELNITDICNRACTFCPQGQGFKGTGFMTNKTAYSIADQIEKLNWSGLIAICGFGEPFMHKQILKIIDIMPDKCNLNITTNGDILYSKPRLLNGLLSRKINKIIVSIYDGQSQYDMFKKVWGQYDIFEFCQLEDREPNFSNRGGSVDIGKKARNGNCYIPFYQLFIDVDGTIRLCCNDWKRIKGYGKNILKGWEELDRIYNGMRNFLPCSDCSVEGTLFGKEEFDQFNSFRMK